MRYPFFTGLRQSRYTGVRAAPTDIGINDLDIAMALQDSSSTIEMIRRGQCIAALPSYTIEHDIASGDRVIP